MPAELLSEQLVLLILIIVGSFVTSTSVVALNAFLKTQKMVVYQERLGYFFDLIGYAWVDRVNTLAAVPPGTTWIQASGTTLRINVNGTTLTENYPFGVHLANTTNPECLIIRYTQAGLYISTTNGVTCTWRAS
ncbi:MAG: hypothetical protein QW514_00635 [Thermoprotei archaeon]